jgi:hypothetical protein
MPSQGRTLGTPGERLPDQHEASLGDWSASGLATARQSAPGKPPRSTRGVADHCWIASINAKMPRADLTERGGDDVRHREKVVDDPR